MLTCTEVPRNGGDGFATGSRGWIATGGDGVMPRPEDGNEAQLDMITGTGRTGQALATARTAAGLDLVDIARETRVPLRHLKAIEADAHDALPALPYAIGFVKSFARAVGLDPEATAAQFRAETTKTPHVPSVAAIEPLDERRMPSRGLVLVSVAAVVLIIGGLSAWGSGVFDAPVPPVPAAVAPAAQPAAGTAAAEGTMAAEGVPAAAANIAPSEPVASRVAPVAGGPVVLTAKEDVWVKIYDPATKISAKTGVLKTGETFAVPAGPALALWTGKVGMIEVSVGGRTLPPLGGPVETVRALSLAPADLLARPAAAPAGAATGSIAANSGAPR